MRHFSQLWDLFRDLAKTVKKCDMTDKPHLICGSKRNNHLPKTSLTCWLWLYIGARSYIWEVTNRYNTRSGSAAGVAIQIFRLSWRHMNKDLTNGATAGSVYAMVNFGHIWTICSWSFRWMCSYFILLTQVTYFCWLNRMDTGTYDHFAGFAILYKPHSANVRRWLL